MKPQRGEIWLTNFDPIIGSEIGKKRPSVVMSSNAIGVLPLRIVIPLTSWQEKFNSSPWLIKIEANSRNKLSQDSAADTFQIKSVSNQRFIKKIGAVSNDKLKEIIMGVSICLDVF